MSGKIVPIKSQSEDWYRLYPSSVPKEIDLDHHRCVSDSISEVCRKFQSRSAITCMGASISFADFEEQANHFASYLQNVAQLNAGERIAIMLPNIIQFPVSFLGAQKAGLICVHTNPLYTPREMLHQFSDSGVTAIVILDMFVDKLEEILPDTKLRHIIVTSIADQLPFLNALIVQTVLRLQGAIPKSKMNFVSYKQAIASGKKTSWKPIKQNLDDVCILQYTGGTTGISKGAMLTHRNVLANMEQIRAWASEAIVEGEENALTALPLYHIFALTVNFLAFLSLGSHMILVPKPIPIKNTVKLFRKYKITVLTGVNTLFNAMNNSPAFKKIAPRTIKVAIAGGMALQDSVNKAWSDITGNSIIEGFGLTESSPVTHCNLLKTDRPKGSIGLPLPSTHAKIVNDSGEELPHGDVGELIISGPQVMKGYWQKPEETKKILRDGWLWTGDIARRDQDGYFYIVDRKKDMILVSGFNVYPNEVEDIIMQHPKVLEVAVIGIPDQNAGEAVKAFVVKKDPSLTDRELREHCAKLLTNYKRPKSIEFRDSLPKTNVGKILRRELRSTPQAS